MAQQTAVGFLVEKLYEAGYFYYVQQTELIEQANKMFEEQIGQAYMEGLIDGMNQQPKEYYKQTYGKE
jgi:hypothetical protein